MLIPAAVVLIALPWLNPFAPGPSPGVVPWLVALACAAGLAGVGVIESRGLTGARRVNTGRAARWQQTIAAAWLAAGLLSCSMALVQYFGMTGPVSTLVNTANFGEAFANLRQRNQFATLTNIALAALLWLAVRPATDLGSAKTARFGLALAATCLLAVGNAVSSSRTGMVQLLLLCGLYAVRGFDRRTGALHLLFCAVLVYAVAMFAIPWAAGLDLEAHGALARFGNEEACAGRLTLWSNVLHLIAQKPWLGWGWGELDYAHFITLYDGPRFCDILDNAHNLPLHLAVELGVPVALLVCGGFAWWALRQKPWAERDNTRQLAWAVLAVILLHSMLEYPLWYGPFQVAFGVCVLILWRTPKASFEAENNPKSPSNTAIAQLNRAQAAMTIVACLVALMAVTYAGWDYHRVSQIYLQPESRHPAYRADTLAQAKKSWLFADQALFAELILTPLTPTAAERIYASATRLLHYSPEPRVIEKLIESAVMLGRDDDALAYLARYRAAFPKEHAVWAAGNQKATRTNN